MDRIFSNNLMSLEPVYIESLGDCTEVFVENHNPFIIEKTISTVLNLIYKYYLLDIKETNKLCKKYINVKNLLPIPFDKDNIFIPFKCRIPKRDGDKAFGYLNLNFLDSVIYEKNYIIINFKDNQYTKSISKPYSFKNHLNNGNLLKYNYKKREMITTNSHVYTPTKESDLNILLREIDEIKDYLKQNL